MQFPLRRPAHPNSRRGACDFVRRTLLRQGYSGLTEAHKRVVRRFVAKVTGLSRAQTTRLLAQHHKTGRIEDRRRGAPRPFERRYRAADIALLAEVDETLGGLCGPATRRVMRRQYEVFGEAVEPPLVPSAPLPEGPATTQSHDEDEAHPGQR